MMFTICSGTTKTGISVETRFKLSAPGHNTTRPNRVLRLVSRHISVISKPTVKHVGWLDFNLQCPTKVILVHFCQMHRLCAIIRCLKA